MLVLGMVIAMVGLVLIFLLGVALVLIVIELIARLALTSAFCAIAGVIAGICSHLAGADGTLIGSLTATVLFLPTLLLVNRWRSAFAFSSPSTKATLSEECSLVPLDEHARAWSTARNFAQSGALDSAYDASVRLLEIVDRRGSIDPELIELAVMLRRHVPALVDETERAIATATTNERRTAEAALVGDLQRLGAHASTLLRQRSAQAKEKLAVRRARLFGEGSAM